MFGGVGTGAGSCVSHPGPARDAAGTGHVRVRSRRPRAPTIWRRRSSGLSLSDGRAPEGAAPAAAGDGKVRGVSVNGSKQRAFSRMHA